MPIYEYQCDDCGNVFEELLLGSDSDPENCPKCEKENVHRVISSTSFQLKGGGWYVTDYKSPPASTSGSSDESSSSDTSESSDSASSDSTSSDDSGTSTSDDSSAA